MSLHDHVGGPEWDAAMKDRHRIEQHVADRWAHATIDAAEAVELLRDIWPSHHRAMLPTVQADIRDALHHLEAAWRLLDGLVEDVMGSEFDDVVNYADGVPSDGSGS